MKNKKVWIIALILIMSVFLIGARIMTNNRDSDQKYKITIVTKGDITASVSSTGRLNPINTVKVGSQVSGKIQDLFVDFNSPVKKNQVIAIIDPAVYSAKKEQEKAQLLMAKMQLQERLRDISAARAGLRSAKANLSSVKAVLQEAELKFNRLAKLKKNRIIAKSDFDSAQAGMEKAMGAVEMAHAAIQAAQAQVKRVIAQKKGTEALISQRQAELELAEIQLNYCTIKSPIDGIVISRNVDVGQTVAATLQSPVLFTIAEDLERMQIEVDVSEADVGQVKQDQDVIFTVDAFPDKEFKAKLLQIRNAATSIQNVVTYKIIADIENDALLLRPGMTANVVILISSVKDAIKVPNSVLRFKVPGKEKEKEKKRFPAPRKTDLFKKTTKKLKLNVDQQNELEQIIKKAGHVFKATYALSEKDRDWGKTGKLFYKQVFADLYKIIKSDQKKEFKSHLADLKQFNQYKKKYKARKAKVYTLNNNNELIEVHILAGITDETETQILRGLKEGDKVVAGLKLNSKKSQGSKNIFANLMKRGK